MSYLVAGLFTGFGLLLSLIITTVILILLLAKVSYLSSGPVNNVIEYLNKYASGLTKKQTKKIWWWILISHKKVTLLDDYLDEGMSMVEAYNKVINKEN